jgi:hypothetical protein
MGTGLIFRVSFYLSPASLKAQSLFFLLCVLCGKPWQFYRTGIQLSSVIPAKAGIQAERVLFCHFTSMPR